MDRWSRPVEHFWIYKLDGMTDIQACGADSRLTKEPCRGLSRSTPGIRCACWRRVAVRYEKALSKTSSMSADCTASAHWREVSCSVTIITWVAHISGARFRWNLS